MKIQFPKDAVYFINNNIETEIDTNADYFRSDREFYVNITVRPNGYWSDVIRCRLQEKRNVPNAPNAPLECELSHSSGARMGSPSKDQPNLVAIESDILAEKEFAKAILNLADIARTLEAYFNFGIEYPVAPSVPIVANDDVTTFLANLRSAAFDQKSVKVGSGIFKPDECRRIAQALELLQELQKNPDRSLNEYVRDNQAKNIEKGIKKSVKPISKGLSI